MKLLLLLIIALVIASGLAYQVHLDPGYALLTYGEFSIETSLAVLIFVALVAFIVLAVLLKLLIGIKRTPKKLGKWNKHRIQKRSLKELNRGLLDSAEGNWKRSEKFLTKHAKQSDTPLLNYLSAAHAAQSQGAYDRRDKHLLNAGETLPEQGHAIHLTRAKLQFSAGQYEQALATLQQLLSATPNHPIVLTILLKTFARLNDWGAIYNILPVVKKNRDIPTEEWQGLEQQTLINLLSSNAQSNHSEFDAVWQNLSKKQQLTPELLTIYASHKIIKQEEKGVADVILKSIKSNNDESLIDLYCQLNLEPKQKLKQLEKWLTSFPSSTLLLNHLGESHIEEQLWGKALSYLEQSIQLKPTSLAYLLLGTLHEKQGETPEQATELYRFGIELANNKTSTELAPSANAPEQNQVENTES